MSTPTADNNSNNNNRLLQVISNLWTPHVAHVAARNIIRSTCKLVIDQIDWWLPTCGLVMLCSEWLNLSNEKENIFCWKRKVVDNWNLNQELYNSLCCEHLDMIKSRFSSLFNVIYNNACHNHLHFNERKYACCLDAHCMWKFRK